MTLVVIFGLPAVGKMAVERKYRMNSNGEFSYPDRNLHIENTNLSAREAAEQIAQHFRLAPKPNASG
jgi:hypothetical protein